MNILNLEPEGYSEKAREILRGLGDLIEGPLDRRSLLATIPNVDVLVTRFTHSIDREVLLAGERLTAVVTAATGLDHIDVEVAAERGIEIISLQGETEFLRTIPATAEHTWALLLCLARRIASAHTDVISGNWERDRFRGIELRGRNLGVIGYGRVGRMVAQYGVCFGMTVRAVDPKGVGAEHVADVPLDQLLRLSDVVTLHVPLNRQTTGMIGSAELKQMRSGAILINTSRGGVVIESALTAALSSGHLRGAALDVIPAERDEARRNMSSLLRYARENDNLLITPHIGGATYESMERTEILTASKLAQFLQSRGD